MPLRVDRGGNVENRQIDGEQDHIVVRHYLPAESLPAFRHGVSYFLFTFF